MMNALYLETERCREAYLKHKRTHLEVQEFYSDVQWYKEVKEGREERLVVVASSTLRVAHESPASRCVRMTLRPVRCEVASTRE